MCAIDTSPACQVIQRVVEELILIYVIHVLDNVVPDILERNYIDERVVLGNYLCLGRTKIKVQPARSSLNRLDDRLGAGVRLDVSPIEGGDGLFSTKH